MDRGISPLLIISTLAAASAGPARAGQFRAVEHPFMLWDKKDIAALRRRVGTEPWAKAALERLGRDRKGRARAAEELIRFVATGDEKLAAEQKARLLRVLKSPVPRGGAQWLTALRYDLLYDSLSADERAAFEEMARIYIQNAVFENAVFNPKIFNDSAHYSRYDARKYTRTNWLPNIIFPRKVSANLLAAALRDEELIRRTWAHYGSWKWYFDEYLCDSGFYSEELSKMGATPGAMLVYCIAVERLGLGELGFGYKGRQGATMRGHIESVIHLGYPRIDVCSDRPQYPMVTMGDLRQTGSSQAVNLPSPAFQHSIVGGYTPDGSGGNLRWRAHGAWGGEVRGRQPQWDGYGGFTPKMQVPLWFELGAVRWPQSGFAYFLAQMRPPGQDAYIPSLLFGLEPVEAAKVEPPPAPSAVWPQRGILMLRAEESPAYWQSPAPAVAMRAASNYAHNVRDAFALLGYYALNRPIYLNRQAWPGYATGWSRSIQSHCGITVDGKEPNFTDATTVRHAFAKDVKFAAATSKEVFEGVELTRSLFLTREYLLDVTRPAAAEKHDYTWIVHTLGALREDKHPWKPGGLPARLHPLKDVRSFQPPGDWSVTAEQVCTLEDPSQAKLPRSWYDRKVGVRVRMLGSPGTRVCAARTPEPLVSVRDKKGKRTVERPSEVGGLTLLVHRRAGSTTFAAVHEPFENAASRLTAVRFRGSSSGGIWVEARGGGYTDHLLLSFAAEPARPCTFRGGGEAISFIDFAYIRVTAEQVAVTTRALKDLRLRVGSARPKLLVNGRPVRARLDGPLMVLGGAK